MSPKDAASQFEYYLLPGKFSPDPWKSELQDKVYAFWKSFWIQEMKNLNSHDAGYVLSDDFIRQDSISILWHESGIGGVLLNTVYRLDRLAGRDCKYLSAFPRSAIEAFDRRGVKSLNTLEYLAVNADLRASKTGVSMGAVLVNLCLRRAKEIGADVSVGVARMDYQVNKVCRNYGGLPLGVVERHNVSCEIVGIFTKDIVAYPKPGVDDVTKELWGKRIDLTGESNQPRTLKVA